VAFQALLNALDQYHNHQVILTFPNADDGGSGIIRMLEDYRTARPERVFAIASLGHIRYLSAVKHCAAVIGNSSSGIIEAPSFGKPTVNIGIRQKGRVSASSVIHCESSQASITNAIARALSLEFQQRASQVTNPYGRGNSSARVLNMIKKLNKPETKAFFDIDNIKESVAR